MKAKIFVKELGLKIHIAALTFMFKYLLLFSARPSMFEKTFDYTLESCFSRNTGARPVDDDVSRHIVLLTNGEASDKVLQDQSMVSWLQERWIKILVVQSVTTYKKEIYLNN